MKMDIKGWKLNPHVWGVPIDCQETIMLLKELAVWVSMIGYTFPLKECQG